MNRDPKTLETGSQATDALEMMETEAIELLPYKIAGLIKQHRLLVQRLDFACHGIVDAERPTPSSLALSAVGRVHAQMLA